MNNKKLAVALLELCEFGLPHKLHRNSSPEQRQAEIIYSSHNARAMTICFEALEILGDPKTKSELFLALDLLPYTGAGGSEMTIRYSIRLLSGDYLDDSNSPCYIHKTDNPDIDNGMFYTQLGKAYEHFYDLEKALQCHRQAFELYPCYICNIPDIVRCLNRLGRMDETLVFLENLKTTTRYKSKYQYNSFGDKEENNFKRLVDEAYTDTLAKKKSGYIYKPRNRK